MPSIHPAWLLSCTIVLGVAAPAPAEALRPSAARRVEENAAAVTAELREVIAGSTTAEGEQLLAVVERESSRWGVRYRDGYLLFSIPVTKNLTARAKADGEREAAGLAVTTLAQKFSRLLELDDRSQGLDAASVRVIFIEPDAERAYAALLGSMGRGFGLGGTTPAGGGFATCPCLPPAPVVACGCE